MYTAKGNFDQKIKSKHKLSSLENAVLNFHEVNQDCKDMYNILISRQKKAIKLHKKNG